MKCRGMSFVTFRLLITTLINPPADCKTSMHPECSEKSTSSCVLAVVTPKKSKDSKNVS